MNYSYQAAGHFQECLQSEQSETNYRQKIVLPYLQVFLILLLISSSWSFINLLRIKATFVSLLVFRISYICILLAFIHQIWIYLIKFNPSGDIEKNPGPKPNSYQCFSIYHCNLFLFITLIYFPA